MYTLLVSGAVNVRYPSGTEVQFTPRIKMYYGSGQGKPEKSTGPPKPASASRRLIITAIAASSLPSDGTGFGDSFIVVPPIISIISSSGDAPKRMGVLRYAKQSSIYSHGMAIDATLNDSALPNENIHVYVLRA